VSELQQAHCTTAFLSSSKALAHDSAATSLKMYHSIETQETTDEHTVPKEPTYEKNNKPLLAIIEVSARICDQRQDSPRRAGDGRREGGRVSWKEAKSQRIEVCLLNICCQCIPRN